MLHMVILSHTAESCPGRPENQHIVACVGKTNELIRERGIKLTGSWADPPSHVNYMHPGCTKHPRDPTAARG